ncbi:hypothetical protein GpartN1_g1189.t1 [Galdieria partita]|uniref:Uncharacterized protein n=1 Tax=Galdieria partita TaxID=83374 RepID=A0A9C7UN42_9RHOD|nr:hypothetical protein GpartN1_g1189.t1 [Galdieria partita]
MLHLRLSRLLVTRQSVKPRYFSDQTSKNSEFPFDKPLLKWKPLEKAEEEIIFNDRLRFATDCIVLGATGLVIYKMVYRFLYGPPER